MSSSVTAALRRRLETWEPDRRERYFDVVSRCVARGMSQADAMIAVYRDVAPSCRGRGPSRADLEAARIDAEFLALARQIRDQNDQHANELLEQVERTLALIDSLGDAHV